MLWLGLPGAAKAQPEVGAQPESAQSEAATTSADSTFHDQQEVTAVDLVVGLELKGANAFKAWGRGLKLPPGLELDDFEIFVAGQKRTLVALEEIRENRPVASEPWTQVIFIDLAGSRSRDLGMGLEALAQRAEELTEIGPVQVLWRRATETGDVLETVMATTRDGGELRQTLAKIALTVEGQDELTSVRYRLRREFLDQPWTERAAARRLEKAWREEEALAIAHQDTLLTYLVDVGRSSGARRAVYWVTSGFDANPDRYYGLESVQPASDEESHSSLTQLPLARETEFFARTLAAYGWVVFPVVPPPPDPLRGKGSGKRLGKWRFLGLMANYEAERLPKRAEAYLELGDAHRRGGRWQEASEASDRAYFHFWGDPRTKSRQALALVGLGEVLEHMGESTASRRAMEMAVDLDAAVAADAIRSRIQERADAGLWAIRESGDSEGLFSIEDRMRFLEGGLKNRLLPLTRVAQETSGARLTDEREVFETMDDLRLRLRLTFQLAGAAEGELKSVDATWDEASADGELQSSDSEGKASLRYGRWIRSGVPARLTRAMARRLLVEGAMQPGAGLDGILRVEPLELVAGVLRLRLESMPGVRPPRTLRVAVASGGAGEPPRVAEFMWRPDDPAFLATLEVHEPTLSVVWQDIENGQWGAGRFPTGLE